MAKVVDRKPQVRFLDPVELRRILTEQNEVLGFTADPAATPAQARRLILESGVKPGDNLASQGILAMRDGEE